MFVSPFTGIQAFKWEIYEPICEHRLIFVHRILTYQAGNTATIPLSLRRASQGVPQSYQDSSWFQPSWRQIPSSAHEQTTNVSLGVSHDNKYHDMLLQCSSAFRQAWKASYHMEHLQCSCSIFCFVSPRQVATKSAPNVLHDMQWIKIHHS